MQLNTVRIAASCRLDLLHVCDEAVYCGRKIHLDAVFLVGACSGDDCLKARDAECRIILEFLDLVIQAQLNDHGFHKRSHRLLLEARTDGKQATDEGDIRQVALRLGRGIRIMFNQLSEEQKTDIKGKLREIEEVNSVITQENGSRTLFELGVPNSVDQMALGEDIAEQFGNAEVIETSQDGAVAGGHVLICAVLLLMVILFSMCRSWLEPILFLTSTGIAVLLNVGTNALLPSVSVTTNSIVGVLQLVLSMDYSIILLNHFRQDKALTDDSVEAMRRAMHRAAAPIISSALTTIVGLIMLVFMKLKIGTDLGVVLSKGVLCSLICNFTVLPSLILMFEKAIYKSAKKVLPISTDKLANFSMRFRIPLTILFVVIFVSSYILHNQTDIIFYNDTESQIEQYFPKKNPVVLVYDNADEKKMLPLLDSISKDASVDMVISYPTLLHRECTAPEMVKTITDLSAMMGSMAPEADPDLNMDMLTDDIFKVVYYAAHSGHQELAMEFNEMSDFIINYGT